MAQITMIIGSIALFVAGFVAWYTLRHRRVETALERIPVRSRQSVDLRRRDLPGDAVQQ